MLGSTKLGKLFGIDLYVHGTFWLLPLFVAVTGFGSPASEIAFDVLFVFAVFACVALHEVGHALAAAMYGIRTRDITLYPVGGIAALEGMPEKPRHEIVVALAGPAVNVVIAVGLFLGVLASGLLMPWDAVDYTPDEFLARLFAANVALCVFNLVPAFPMDGGRVLRALLATRLTRLRATAVAVKVSTVMALLFLIAGVALVKFGLIAIAVVVWLLSQAELARLRVAAMRDELERRARTFFDGPQTELPLDATADLAARRFTGLAWDAARGVWVRWTNGVPVGELPG